jgi:hypothetical protein
MFLFFADLIRVLNQSKPSAVKSMMGFNRMSRLRDAQLELFGISRSIASCRTCQSKIESNFWTVYLYLHSRISKVYWAFFPVAWALECLLLDLY